MRHSHICVSIHVAAASFVFTDFVFFSLKHYLTSDLLPVASRDRMQIAWASSGKTLLTRRTEKRHVCKRLFVLITLCPWPTCQVSYLRLWSYIFPSGCCVGSPRRKQATSAFGLHAKVFVSSAISIRGSFLHCGLPPSTTRCRQGVNEHLACGSLLKLFHNSK